MDMDFTADTEFPQLHQFEERKTFRTRNKAVEKRIPFILFFFISRVILGIYFRIKETLHVIRR